MFTKKSLTLHVPADNYMFKVNNRNTRTRCEIYSKLTIKTRVTYIKYFAPCFSVSIVNFEQVNAGWGVKAVENAVTYLANWVSHRLRKTSGNAACSL